MRKDQRARRWLMRELDRLSEKRQCDQSRKLAAQPLPNRQRLRATERA
jgi:hypothetical protein